MANGAGGRPREYDRAHVQKQLCERVAAGELAKDVCFSFGLSPSTPFKWAQEDPEFGKAYEQARIMQAHALAEGLIEIAEGRDELTELWETLIEMEEDELENMAPEKRREFINRLRTGVIQRDTLRVNTGKWFVSKLAPKIYGDKLDLTSGGQPLPPQMVSVVFVNAPQGMEGALVSGAQVPPPGLVHAPQASLPDRSEVEP